MSVLVSATFTSPQERDGWKQTTSVLLFRLCMAHSTAGLTSCWLGVSVTLSKRRSLNRCSIRSSVPVQTDWSSTGFVSSFLQKKLQELYWWVLFTCLLVFDFTFWPLVMVKVASQLQSQERDEHLTGKSIGKLWNSVISTNIYKYIIHIYWYVFFSHSLSALKAAAQKTWQVSFYEVVWFGCQCDDSPCCLTLLHNAASRKAIL